MKRHAQFSRCGTYRFTLGRIWDERPELLVVMFNPSDADAQIDDPTITLLCHIASHNGFGSILVVNAIPLIAAAPPDAIAMANWDKPVLDRHARDCLRDNLAVIVGHVSRAGAVLLAWGAIGECCSEWLDRVRDEIERALQPGVPLYCLGKTAGGYPKHPLARGKHKVPKDAPLLPWSPQ